MGAGGTNGGVCVAGGGPPAAAAAACVGCAMSDRCTAGATSYVDVSAVGYLHVARGLLCAVVQGASGPRLLLPIDGHCEPEFDRCRLRCPSASHSAAKSGPAARSLSGLSVCDAKQVVWREM